MMRKNTGFTFFEEKGKTLKNFAKIFYKQNSKRGFTIIESLVVIAILAIVGILVLVIFTQSLRGNNRGQILSSIKKNGQAVLETIDKTIRNADKIVCTGTYYTSYTTNSDTLVVVAGGNYTRYRFIPPSGSTDNGKIQQDFPTPPSVAANDPKYSKIYICNNPLGVESSSTTPQTLTDTDTNTGASVQNGSFTRNAKAGFKDTVTISFQIAPPVGASPSLAGQIDPVTFSETVELR